MQLTNATEQEAPAEPIVDPKGADTWYDVLEVSPRASDAVIQAAYRALARATHPDHNKDEAAAERMRELNRARDVLLDPRRRTMYDLNIGQQKTTKMTDVQGTSVRRAHTCWQCEQTLSAFAAYCGRCRWLVCEQCRTCGCTHPDWKAPSELGNDPLLQRVGPLTRLGWIVVGTLVMLVALAGAGAWAMASHA